MRYWWRRERRSNYITLVRATVDSSNADPQQDSHLPHAVYLCVEVRRSLRSTLFIHWRTRRLGLDGL